MYKFVQRIENIFELRYHTLTPLKNSTHFHTYIKISAKTQLLSNKRRLFMPFLHLANQIVNIPAKVVQCGIANDLVPRNECWLV